MQQATAANEPKTQGVTSLIATVLDGLGTMNRQTARSTINALRLTTYATHQVLEGNVFPAMDAVVNMNEQWNASLLSSLRDGRGIGGFAKETFDRMRAGSRYERLMKSMGRELYGTARFAGETVLASDEYLRLTYIPPKEGVARQPVSLFHAGGGIPYGDKIFRFLPEANFYDRFLERGIPVYAVEVRGDRYDVNYSGLTLEHLIDAFADFSAVAFEHNERRKMVLEGYCGHGMQTLAFVAARPEEAEERFNLACTFVSPYDGTECTELSQLTMLTPEVAQSMTFAMTELVGGYVHADAMRFNLDLGLKTLFHKTPLGHFAAGWAQTGYAKVRSVGDLDATQRRDLAGAYWISAESARRFPIPVDLARFASKLFGKGISKTGDIPYSYKGTPLSFQTILKRTTLPLIGFFGGRDVMVPDRTAYGVMNVMGDRYAHIVHPNAGHISYILSPKSWLPSNPKGLKPNPVDLILERASR